MGSDSVAKADGAAAAAGTSVWKVAYGINLHKIMCAPVIYGFMRWYDCYTVAAWTYLTVHGTYGLIWVLKDCIYPDRNFQQPCPFFDTFAAFMFCNVSYFSYPWILVSNGGRAAPWCLPLAVVVFCLGMFLMHGADCQKYYTLKYAPEKLITTGFFKYVRNPNYLGEFLIYVTFALLTGSPYGLIGNAVALLLWLGNMAEKDRSMSRYPEFAEWKASTYQFLPPLI